MPLCEVPANSVFSSGDRKLRTDYVATVPVNGRGTRTTCSHCRRELACVAAVFAGKPAVCGRADCLLCAVCSLRRAPIGSTSLKLAGRRITFTTSAARSGGGGNKGATKRTETVRNRFGSNSRRIPHHQEKTRPAEVCRDPIRLLLIPRSQVRPLHGPSHDPRSQPVSRESSRLSSSAGGSGASTCRTRLIICRIESVMGYLRRLLPSDRKPQTSRRSLRARALDG